MFICAAGILRKALFAGAKMVRACMEARSPARPAVLTSDANVLSSGLCDAAVTTESMLMLCRLPMPLLGIMPQSGPNAADSAIGCELEWVIGWWVAVPLAALPPEFAAELPHPAASAR